MNQSNTLEAANPEHSACVLASAGTGKTWLLVTRLIRLLLAGAEPQRILAVTFTRKAAGEMQQRLSERLRGFLEASDAELDGLLKEIGERPDTTLRQRARALFEQLLLSEQPLRTATFHSFCQDLLKRFPLEAGLPPGFDLADTTGLLYEQSWDALFAEATQQSDGALATDLDTLFDQCNGLHNTQNALFSFLSHRSDWWAYTQGESDATGFARQQLTEWLGIDSNKDPSDYFWNKSNQQTLQEFASLIRKHPGKTNDYHCELIEQAFEKSEPLIDPLLPVFFKADGERRTRGTKAIQIKKMGVEGEARFLELHDQLCAQLETYKDQKARLNTLQASIAWYQTGARLLEYYQQIKRERRLVDFTDLEWKAYVLLSHSEQAHWIQYKLDQRIDHLLIDEFQDTNPTQWHLLKPLLEELAANNEKTRSLFLVGDAKQSIYRFRRGDPALLQTATIAMQQQLGAKQYQLDRSWRSAPAILECINKIFRNTELGSLLPGFTPHDTHHTELWGRVELWPLFADNAEETEPYTASTGLRNPLVEPRQVQINQSHYLEGHAIAQHINALVEKKTLIGSANQARALNYNDIIILLRSRTYLTDYETALRNQNIPYLSIDRGTLLESLEIRDMQALLNVLMTPQDNLSLAQVLRSPIFRATDNDLVILASGPREAWIDKLAKLANTLPEQHPLLRAHLLLKDWSELAGRIPIHDLLDHIFHEADILACYQTAFPDALAPRVRANLIRFIELALEIDAGRYPSLPYFLSRLRQLRRLDGEAPDQAPPESDTGQRVRIMTIHAAKGLEAPVVFLADSGRQQQPKKPYNTLVRWPSDKQRPTQMLLTGKRAEIDSKTRDLLELENIEEQRESANLLYVALTRAQQMLFITGCSADKSSDKSWHQAISANLLDGDTEKDHFIAESGKMPDKYTQIEPEKPANPKIDPRLTQPISLPPRWIEIAPSHSGDDEYPSSTGSGRLRGHAIHRMLQLATSSISIDGQQLCQQVAGDLSNTIGHQTLLKWWQDIHPMIMNPEFGWLFNPPPEHTSYNEVPIEYTQQNTTVFGIIDRLVVSSEEARLVDYKTHHISNEETLQDLCIHYQDQLTLYREGIERLWPGKRAHTYLLFTDIGRLVEI